MLKKIKSFFRKLFSKQFIHPEVNKRLSNAIDDKIARRNEDTEKEINKNTEVLNSYLRTYFDKKYSSQSKMQVSFQTCNKQWLKHCREINSTNKLINVDKKAFEKQVKLVINKLKENG